MSYCYTDLFREYLYSQEFEEPLKPILEYILFNEGHWIRPQMVMAWCEACGGDPTKALPLALAIEYIHTASLIHDDLPCMDNGTSRRGKDCLHIVYGDAAAVLTGDVLFNLAISVIVNSDLSIEQKNHAFTIMSTINTSLCLGQLSELIELPQIDDEEEKITKLLEIHRNKTAELIRGACIMGVVAAERYTCFNDANRFGYSAGMWYQLLDDIHDEDGLSLLLPEAELDDLIAQYRQDCLITNTVIKSEYLNNITQNLIK